MMNHDCIDSSCNQSNHKNTLHFLPPHSSQKYYKVHVNYPQTTKKSSTLTTSLKVPTTTLSLGLLASLESLTSSITHTTQRITNKPMYPSNKSRAPLLLGWKSSFQCLIVSNTECVCELKNNRRLCGSILRWWDNHSMSN